MKIRKNQFKLIKGLVNFEFLKCNKLNLVKYLFIGEGREGPKTIFFFLIFY